MKLVWKILIPTIGSILILVFFLIVPVIILGKSWWWFFIPLIFLLVIWAFIGIIIFIINLRKKTPQQLKLDIKSAKARAIREMMYDSENPDNFKIDQTKLERWGERGAEQTPILILDGKGTEKNQRRVVIINLNNQKQEATKLINPTDDEIERQVKLMAEHPPEEIREEKITSYEGGLPTTRVITRRPSYIEQKKQEEEKKTEQQAGI